MKKSGKTIGNILIAALFLSVSAYIIFQFVRKNLNEYQTDVASYVTYNNSLQAEAVIFRDETLITSDASGSVRYLVGNGNRVGKNDAILNIYSSDSAAEDHNAADKLREKLDLYRKSNIAAVGDISTNDDLSKKSYISYLSGLRGKKYGEVIASGKDLTVYLNRRLITVGRISGFDRIITALTLKINELEGGSAAPAKVVTAPFSGFFYKSADGYENTYKTAVLSSLTIEDFEKLVNSEPEAVPSNVIGKLSAGYVWYFACEVTASDAAKFELNSGRKVTFPLNSYKSISAVLYKKIEQPKNDKAVLIFMTSDFPSGFSYRRRQKVNLTSEFIEGVRVPVEAVRVLDGETGVYVIVGSRIYFRKIDVIFSSGLYYISAVKDADPESEHQYLSINETVIVNGKDIYEGKVIE